MATPRRRRAQLPHARTSRWISASRKRKAAAGTDPELADLWKSISARRAKNICLFAEELLASGELGEELTVERVVDVIRSINSPEYYLPFVIERGWSEDDFSNWLFQA